MAQNTGSNLTPQQLADVPNKEFIVKTAYEADKPIATLWDGSKPVGRINAGSLHTLSQFVEGKNFDRGSTRDADASPMR